MNDAKPMLKVNDFLEKAQKEVGKFDWHGTFAEYLSILSERPHIARLSHKLVYDAIMSSKTGTSQQTGAKTYNLFDKEVYGQDDTIESIVQYFDSSAERLEIRKRILLLLGPPASGKSTIVALIKKAIENFTRTDDGAVYAIRGCPMQEDPLHLVPSDLREELEREYGIYVEGDLCPRCRYIVRTQYGGNIGAVPVIRVVFSEQEAVGIGYYVATSNPTDASLLVGSVDTAQLEGDRLEVAGKAFRMDGELNVANRGLMEFVEIFKVESHLLTTLLGLAQEQLIKMDRFGSVYADEVLIGHSNEGDFKTFMADPSSEALRDRIMRINIPYNLRVSEEEKIYRKMMDTSGLRVRNSSDTDDADKDEGKIHVPPQTLPVVGTFAVLSRLKPPRKQGVSLIEKLRAYDGQEVGNFGQEEAQAERQAYKNEWMDNRVSPATTGASQYSRTSREDALSSWLSYRSEGMSGISPRSVMNRLSVRASMPDVRCLSPLNALDSIWAGRTENVSLTEEESAKYLEYITESVREYEERALDDVQKVFENRFEQNAQDLLENYLLEIESALTLRGSSSSPSQESEHNMHEIERAASVSERNKWQFRREIHEFFAERRARKITFDYTTEPRIRASIEKLLFPDRRTLNRDLEKPKSAANLADWRRRRSAMHGRLKQNYEYCDICAHDVVEYATFLLRRNNSTFQIARNEIEWQWDMNPQRVIPEWRRDLK